MITNDIKTYIYTNHNSHLEEISELSKSTKGDILVVDKRKLFNFDKITQSLYNDNNYPSSADSLFISNDKCIFIEFKSGFKLKKDFKKLDLSKLTCPDDKEKTCLDYGKLLQAKQKLERSELLDSLRLKAIESYITLDKVINPISDEAVPPNDLKISFWVINDDYVDIEESILLELAEKRTESNTALEIKASLSRLKFHARIPHFYYNEIHILTPHEFKTHLDKVM